MAVKIINEQAVAEARAKNKITERVTLYEGGANSCYANSDPVLSRDVVMTTPVWENSAGRARLLDDIEQLTRKINAAQAPSQAYIDELYGKLIVDITRHRMAGMDITAEIATEMTDPNFPRIIHVRELAEYVGEFANMAGTGDSVPLVDRAGGQTDALELKIRALGYETTLANVLFGEMNEMLKVNAAIAAADVDARNAQTIGTIVGATYRADQKQAADNTTDFSHDQKVHNTLYNAIKKLRKQMDPQTGDTITASDITILANSENREEIENAVNGLARSKGGTGASSWLTIPKLASVKTIIEYDHGKTHGKEWQKKKLEFPGVEANTAYMLVPKKAFWVANKRGLTLETGRGRALQLGQEEKAWYRVDGVYNKPFFGSEKSGCGYIVKIALPVQA